MTMEQRAAIVVFAAGRTGRARTSLISLEA